MVEGAGSGLYVRDVAIELLRCGHTPIVYCFEQGDLSRQLMDRTIPVTDDLAAIGDPPDVIHGQHHLPTMAALQWFSDTPVVGVSHGWRPWDEQPVVHPNVCRYVAVDEAVRDRLRFQHGIPSDSIEIVSNFVDLERFERCAELADPPSRLLVFSNYVSPRSPYHAAAEEAAEILGMSLEVVGAGMGTSTDRPEEVLGRHDVVMAQGRSAIEAMACGASVMIGSSRAFGPLVATSNFDHLRRLNFGIRTQTLPATASTIVDQLGNYDPVDAARVTDRVRSEAGAHDAVQRLLAIYARAVASFEGDPSRVTDATRATGTFVHDVGSFVVETMREVERLRLPASQVPGLIRARDHLSSQLAALRSAHDDLLQANRALELRIVAEAEAPEAIDPAPTGISRAQSVLRRARNATSRRFSTRRRS